MPTFVEGGKLVKAEARSIGSTPTYFKPGTNTKVTGAVAWRLQGSDGAIRGSAQDKAESRADLLNLSKGVKFDFLDANGDAVDYNKSAGDKIVKSWKAADGAWHALVPKTDASGATTGYEHQTLDAAGKSVRSKQAVSVAEGDRLAGAAGAGVMHRVQGQDGALKGDGKVGSYWDMWWWGRCHNTAAIDTSGLKAPAKDVQVVTNLNRAAGDELILSYNGGAGRLVPSRDAAGKVTGYKDAAGANVPVADAARIARERGAQPAILGRDGKVRAAEVSTVTKEEVQTVTSHMDDGATEYKGSLGHRFYGLDDEIKTKDGRTINARILRAETESGKKIDVQHREGFEWRDDTRGTFRGADMKNSERSAGGWQTSAWSESSMDAINRGRSDKLKNVVIEHPDGRTETIPAASIASVGGENAYDSGPEELWKAGTMIKDGKSLTIEKATGTQVWNYAVKNMTTERIDRSKLPASVAGQNDLPGAKAGTTGDDGKLYFKTQAKYLENGKENVKDYYYWVKMDKASGKVTDYNYLVDDKFASAPDFFWQSHVKDPVTQKWEGESQVPGAKMREIQALYNASTGALDPYLVGGVISREDLVARTPVQP